MTSELPHIFLLHCRYRAPGESWTKKFKHVVGILHTNYFQYAMDQPAALIRVRFVVALLVVYLVPFRSTFSS